MITFKVKKVTFFLATSLLVSSTFVLLILHLTGIGDIKQVQAEIKALEKTIKVESQATQTVEKDLKALKTNYNKLNDLFKKEISFKDGLKFVISFEGGLSDDYGDLGGLTNLGITHTEYDRYRSSKGLPWQSVSLISLKEATDIYRHTYWQDSGCSEFTKRVAISCFDDQVNTGRGVRRLQQILGGIPVDGFIGPQTMNEFSFWLSSTGGEDHLLHNYFQSREHDYRLWGVGTQAKFLQGWLNRAESLKHYLNIP